MSYKEKAKANKKETAELFKAAPVDLKAFMHMHDLNMKEDALDVKTKELIALAIAISTKCEGCIIAHVDALAKAGGTREELVAMIKVCLLMNGGPGTVYGAKALAAFDELTAE
ncbi:alkylhydroperoxidase AhpD family core domain-containing protein [Actinobaculum suis]|uniref:Alkylhydroperoxidase AhpD family core domain-containing protein n=1 Tax=Actinobaculum suis TaxID=1657 RepID=A0A7Z8Y7C6_9ACTO|nr:carboxymuconolactone decarboxylase family protein [Actinobaculum suis]VDG75509.1 alkylhydroperoxidase AhpD family core domain-containing protein [Actinobaculum suis]